MKVHPSALKHGVSPEGAIQASEMTPADFARFRGLKWKNPIDPT